MRKYKKNDCNEIRREVRSRKQCQRSTPFMSINVVHAYMATYAYIVFSPRYIIQSPTIILMHVLPPSLQSVSCLSILSCSFFWQSAHFIVLLWSLRTEGTGQWGRPS
ncbi:uncharacterized protein K444DRAFT_134655 [Hyaloscypha bicolor E]|uniref:Uncharacterized protein n=1 Tax=Hyaloscypha bicolor E TaxID=1095630 RepID=A0A2J6STD8_9HELO|nr:uncharacterized protein K444DRAFT_134655 [Hyaloscypha bicolor E]PMD54051.1 hypothetical protein K444DRAFT_134655 [Hyaloscypha bicolor E]